MDASASNLEELMERLGGSGVTMIIKVDHERMAEGGKPWTLVMSGPGLGERGLIRTDSPSFEHAIGYGLGEIRKCPGDWGWLAEIS